MRVAQFVFHKPQELQALASQIQALHADLCLLFASPEYFENDEFIQGLNQCCDNLIGCSAAGEIHQTDVTDHSAVINLLHFDDAQINLFSSELRDMHDSHHSGVNLADQVNHSTPRDTASTQALLILGQGVNINGSGLLEGLQQHLTGNIHISGGLAGDNGLFQRTYTCINDNVYTDRVVAVSIAGKNLTVSHGCYGGWRAFGPLRRITKSTDNVLYELDDLPALEVYKNYLGEYAQQLPASGLLFPFEMISNEHETTGLLRTIIGIDEAQQALILAGHVNCGEYLRLMHSSTDLLVDGAEKAANQVLPDRGNGDAHHHRLAILVSCIGRKLVMGDYVEEEIEAIAETLGTGHYLTGFYSNGEMNRLAGHQQCELHNQTMTITVIGEN